MANEIRVVDSELQACANEYRQSLRTLNDAVREYQSALNALRTDWTGRAFAIMSAHVVNLTGKIINSFERVNDAISELGEVEALFEENEQKQKSKFMSQDTGTKSPFGG
ncbi:MAG: WXG100 family type VII secretion target [Candidatus Ventricola sp.]